MPALNRLKIHHQLPLSTRESQQLLNLLTTSFQRQLDTEHDPKFRKDASKLEAQRSNRPESRRPQRHSHPDLENNYTERHMHSLLTNPLFSLPARTKGTSWKTIKDPMDVFEQAVANGMMNVRYAHACLKQKKRDIVQSSAPTIQDGMREAGAGLKVLRWLVSSGTAKDIDFLRDEPFAELLIEFLVAEGLQEAVWPWVKMGLAGLPALSLRSSEARKQAHRDIVRPLMFLVRAEALTPESYDAAYMCLSRAASYLKGLSTIDMRHVLGAPGGFLLKRIIMSHSDRQPSTESSFESFLRLIPVITPHVELNLAHLSLLHPTTPNPDLALRYLKMIDKFREMPSPDFALNYTRSEDTSRVIHHRVQKKAYALQYSHIQLGLDTAKFLLENSRVSEAEWVLMFLRTNYPERLGVEQERQIEQAKAEATTLGLLDGLSLA